MNNTKEIKHFRDVLAQDVYELLCDLVSAEERNTCDGICLYEFAERAKEILKKVRGQE